MAITDREVSEIQEKLSRKFGTPSLALNTSDQFFLYTHGYVTGSDVLNGAVWRNYKLDNGLDAGFEFDFKAYFTILFELGILGSNEESLVDIQKRKSRALKEADPIAYRQVFAGKAIFTDADDLQGVQKEVQAVVAQVYANLSASVKTELDRKMIEQEFIREIKRNDADNTYYVRVKEGRDVAKRSMQAQGFKVNDQDMRFKNNAPGTRGRFNVFNNRQASNYSTGSWRSGSGAGPRIQGPGGGVGSCKFVIINRSGSI
mgnify:CR=1 FL=1|tara:strand:- start:46 stop:822 length:777 start_codon:yes stop_codon:yes gene_type:complete